MNHKHFHQKTHISLCFPAYTHSPRTPSSNEFATSGLSLEENHLAVEECTLFHISRVVTPVPRNSKTKQDPQIIVPLHCSQLVIQHFCSTAILPFKNSPLNVRHGVQFVQTLAITFIKVHRHNAWVKECREHRVHSVLADVSNPVMRSPEQSRHAPAVDNAPEMPCSCSGQCSKVTRNTV